MTMEFGVSKMFTGLLSIWLCATYCFAQENSTTAANDVSTETPDFSITIEHVESSTSSIQIKWHVPEDYTVKRYIVRSNRVGSEAITTSPDLEETEYIIEDLQTYKDYKVCVIAYLDDDTVHKECDSYATIRLIRDDSLIALFVTIGFIIMCILMGYLCWKYQKHKMEKEQESEEGETAKLNANNTHANPVSSIEDHDIPYITPPLDELSPEERKEYEAANVHV